MGTSPKTIPGWSQGTGSWARSFRHQGFGSGENSNHSAATAFSVEASASQLKAALYSRLSSSQKKEFDSLAKEKDPQMFLEGALAFGERLEDAGQIELAAEVYAAMGAQQRLDALSGRGHSGLRVEFLLKRFTETATDYRTIVPMIAGSMAYQITRSSVLGRLAATPRLSWASRGFGLQMSSAAVGLGVESTVFLASHRGLAAWAGEGGAPTGSLGRDWLGTTLTLGVLKLSGNVGRVLPTPAGAKPALQQVAMFGGLLLAHQIDIALGLRPSVDGATTLTDTLGTWVSLGVGANLGHRMLGPSFARFQQELNYRSREILLQDPRNFNFDALSKVPAWAVLGKSLSTKIPSGPASFPPLGISLMQAQGPGGGPRSYSDEIKSRLEKISPAAKEAIKGKLQKEWDAWRPRQELSPELKEKVEKLIPLYGEIALAHFGPHLPAPLPFFAEIYQEAVRQFSRRHGISANGEERSVLLRFLSTQPGRRMAGEEKPADVPIPLAPSSLSLTQTRNLLSGIYGKYLRTLRRETDRLSGTLLVKAQVYQRGLALLHFYVSYLHAERGEEYFASLDKIPWEGEIFARTLQDSAEHPYPTASLEIFKRFVQAPTEPMGAELSPAADISSASDFPPLEIELPPFQPPLPGESWPHFLARLKITKGRLNAADLGVTGATIFGWGEKKDAEGRAWPPGDILNLLSLVSYLHATHERGVDPLMAARMVLPEQLVDFLPDEQGNIVLRYPELMKDLDYAHFDLAALLRAFLRSTPEASDSDLADRWKVSANTVRDYRRGEYHKMRLDTLYRLARSLVPDPSHETALRERVKLLMFLRYRSYFDATMEVLDRDAQFLQPKAPGASQYRIVLAPDGESLPLLDLTRRIPFEKEPFASALNGTVDLALDLLEGRLKEFEILGEDGVPGREGYFQNTGLRRRIQEFRDEHAKFFQTLSAQARSPSVVQPGQSRQIREFYRDLFRFFEETYLYQRPKGTLNLGETRIEFEIVPPTWEQPRGARVERDPTHPKRFRAWVVAGDLLAHAPDLNPDQLRLVMGLRILQEYLEAENLLLSGTEAREENHRMLSEALAVAGWTRPSEELFRRFELLQWQAAQWRGTLADPEAEATLHRILRGRMSLAARERRELRWQEGLRAWARRERIQSLSPLLEQVFSDYLRGVERPFLQFNLQALQDALAPIRHREGRPTSLILEGHLIRFMKAWGLATAAESKVDPGRLTLEGFANAAFATYLVRFRALHPLQGAGLLIADSALIRQVVEDRLVDFPQFNSHLEKAMARLGELVEEYLQRHPPLKIFGLVESQEILREPFPVPALGRIFSNILGRFRLTHPDFKGEVEERWILSALPALQGKILNAETPLSADLEQALHQAQVRLSDLGWSSRKADPELHRRFFGELVGQLLQLRSRLDRLAEEIPRFVRENGFHSGLQEGETLAIEMAEIFRRHTGSALVEVHPATLREAVLEILGDRFGPYPVLREDVVRGMRAIFHERFIRWRGEYANYLQAFELSRDEARQHGDVDLFRTELLALSSAPGRSWGAPEPWLERLRELEALWVLTGNFEERQLSRELEGIEDEIRAHRPPAPSEAPGLRLLLDTPLSLEDWKEIPEWGWVEAEDLVKEAQLWAAEAPRFLQPEFRPLLHLLALFRNPRAPHIVDLQEIAETIRLEAFTAPEGSTPKDILEAAIETYRKIRPRLIETLDAWDRLQLLPEFPPPGLKLSPVEGANIILTTLMDRRLPFALEETWLGLLDFYSELEKDLGESPFPKKLAEFYLKNRETILSLPEIEMPAEYFRPLAEGVPEESRRKIDLDYPELDWVSDHRLIEKAGLDPRGPDLLAGKYFYFKTGQFLGQLFHAGLGPKNNSLKKNWLGLMKQYLAAKNFLGESTALDRWLNGKIETYYSHYRKEILPLAVKTFGMGPLLENFPEFRNMELSPHYFVYGNVQQESWGFEPPYNSRIWWAVFPQVRRAHADPRLRASLEEILWEIPVSIHNSRYQDQILEWFEKIGQFYLVHRNKLRGLPNSPELDSSNEDIPPAYEELRIWEDEDLLDGKSQLLARAEKKRKEFPDAWLSLAFLGSLPLPLFRWTKALMELGNYQGQGSSLLKKAYEIFYRDFDRISGLLMSGMDLDWAHSLWLKRAKAIYEKVRPVLIGSDHRKEVTLFPEIQDVPPELLEREWEKARASGIPIDILQNKDLELCVRIKLILQYPEVPPRLKQESLDLAQKNASDPFQAALAMSRFYVRNRKEILRHFKGWPDPVEQVRNLPEIQAVPESVIQSEWNLGLRDGRNVQANKEEADLVIRIHANVFTGQVPEAIGRDFKKYLKDHPVRLSQELAQITARYYLQHRREILPFLIPWSENTIASRYVMAYPEIRAVTQKEIDEAAAKHGFSEMFASMPNDILARIIVVLARSEVPLDVKREFSEHMRDAQMVNNLETDLNIVTEWVAKFYDRFRGPRDHMSNP